MASAPTPRAHPVLAPNLQMGIFEFVRQGREDMLAALERWASLGRIARFQSRFFVAHLLTAPEAIQRVLRDHAKNYVKEVRTSGIMVAALGDGLFLSEGEKWRTQRRIAQPAFHRNHLAAMTDAIVEAVDAMLLRWERSADSGKEFDLQNETSQLTLDVIGRTLAGQDFLPYAQTTANAMLAAFDYFNHAFNHVFVAPLFVPTRKNRAFKRAIRTIHDLVDRIVETRKRQEPREERQDLLSMLLEAYGDAEHATELRDNLAIFLGAGTETTAVALLWAWYLLSKHPEAERRLKDEVDSVLHSDRPTHLDLPRLAYTRMVVEEAMRLYPPVWTMSRTAIADDTIGGFHIPAGSTVLLSQWVVHRSRNYWDDPQKFDPERFSDERSGQRAEYAYFPFGGGPRTCIGDRFSVMEQTLALAMTAQRFHVNIRHSGVPDPVFTLRPKGGMRATISTI